MNCVSAMYSGSLRHRRFRPVHHAFEYPVAMIYVDLDEVNQIFNGPLFSAGHRPAPWWFRRRDYLGPLSQDLRSAVQSRIREQYPVYCNTDFGPIRLLTTVRSFGLSFNPISIYYCFDNSGSRLIKQVAEVTNTPWRRRHSYVIPCNTERAADLKSGEQQIQSDMYEFEKKLHVSPFNSMDVKYHWKSTVPDKNARIHLEAHSRAPVKQALFFDATLSVERKTQTLAELRRAMRRTPFSSWSTVYRIYREAFSLWRKGVPLHSNPHK